MLANYRLELTARLQLIRERQQLNLGVRSQIRTFGLTSPP